ncbi:MAG: hypothetical protein CL678_17215 [Bdellovibrionaceae bacterium]|nr:hypothetical protein [Pseudobdellovibrionaceae bacterium]|tara:strand:- start:6255 stop:7367 length:1113 start_codon:yes stop_codon:yes gene_type:complete
MQNPLSLLMEVHGVERFFLGPKPFVFVADADAAGKVLVTQSSVFRQNRFVFDRIQPVTGSKGVVQLEGEESKAARVKSRSVFSKEALQKARFIVEERTQAMIDCSVNCFDPAREITSLILGTAFEIFLGVQIDVEKSGQDYLELNRLCGKRMRSPITFPSFRLRKLQKKIRDLVRDAGNTPLTYAFRNDPYQLDHFLTFLFAGHETTAASIAFSLLLLAQRPELQRKIAMGDQTLTREVYREALRVYPPAYMLARQAEQSMSLEGVRVKRGDTVIVAIYNMHHNEEYFPDHAQFKPGRRSKIPYSYNPFGAGAKACLGERLAYLEAEVVIEAFCKAFEFSGPKNILSEALITLHPKEGQFLNLKKRRVYD